MRPVLALSVAVVVVGCTPPAAVQTRPEPKAEQAPAHPAATHDPADSPMMLVTPEEVADFDWPASEAAAPAGKLFKNVEVMPAVNGKRFMLAMQGMAHGLGVKCGACHVPRDFPNDAKPEKRAARQMLVLADTLNRLWYAKVSCYTCHRGHLKPERVPADLPHPTFAPPMPTVPPNVHTAGKVYANLQVLGGMAPEAVIPAMQQMSGQLGVKCSFCHVPEDWASDQKREKQVARGMMRLAAASNATIFGTDDDPDAVTCWTCHRGQPKPVHVPPAEAAPAAPAQPPAGH